MDESFSVQFFDKQFRRQVSEGEHALNPFEAAALPHLHGSVLDYGCGLGNLAIEAARRGCTVLALDASRAAIQHLGNVARRDALPLRALEADLRTYQLAEDFDTVVCIGLLMFFDCAAADRQLSQLQARTRAGGIAIINVLVQGTTYMDMFGPDAHCLFDPEALRARFSGWEILSFARQDFPAPGDTRKAFATLIARKPDAADAD